MAQKSANPYARIEPEVKEQAEKILSALLNLSEMTAAEISQELEKGYADMKAGRVKQAKDVFADIRKD